MSVSRRSKNVTGHSDGFLEIPAPQLMAQWLAMDDSGGEAPESLGPWRIVREIGRGGMATVYLVERVDSFMKFAALKILRCGIFGEDVCRRFLRERQILADLDHPGIVRLLDGGVAPDRRPYLVMDYVEGESLARSVESRSEESILHLFLLVCDAVSYAHQQGVVHRDLKPTNILVTRDGAPKLADFGVAKLLEGEGVTGGTSASSRYFTPEYASPEQTRGQPVGPESDQYSLALVLCRLLMGRLPYEVNETNPYDNAREICEQTPDLQGVPERLRPVIRRALAKEPPARYPSVELFALEIRQRVEATPSGAMAHLRAAATTAISAHKIPIPATAAALCLAVAVAGFRSRALPERPRAWIQPRQLTFIAGTTHEPAVSRDGKWLTWSGSMGEEGGNTDISDTGARSLHTAGPSHDA